MSLFIARAFALIGCVLLFPVHAFCFGPADWWREVRLITSDEPDLRPTPTPESDPT